MTEGEPSPFDLNRYGDPRPRAERAAAEVTQSDLVKLFSALEAASQLWNEEPVGPKRAALAALAAVNDFAGGQGYNLAGEFTRPLKMLAEEVHSAPAASPGNILPPFDRNQTIEGSRRSDVNRLKASAAYTAKRISDLGGTRGAACNSIAAILSAYRFPMSDYFENDGTRKELEDIPTLPQLAGRVEEWCKRYPYANNEPGRMYRDLENVVPAQLTMLEHLQIEDQRYPLVQWLKDALMAAGYEASS